MSVSQKGGSVSVYRNNLYWTLPLADEAAQPLGSDNLPFLTKLMTDRGIRPADASYFSLFGHVFDVRPSGERIAASHQRPECHRRGGAIS